MKLEKSLQKQESLAEKAMQNWEQCQSKTAEHTKNLDRLEHDLSSRGGAWAATREKELIKQTELSTEKLQLENQLRDIISGSFPITIAGKFLKATLKQLEKEMKQNKAANIAEMIDDRIEVLQKRLGTLLKDDKIYSKVTTAIDKAFKPLNTPKSKTNIIHGISENQFAHIETVIADAFEHQETKAKDLADQLDKISEALDGAGKNIARAPEESAVSPIMARIKKEQAKRADNLAKEKSHLEDHKRALRDAIETVRALDKLSEQSRTREQKNRTLTYANASRDLLKDFSREMAKRKIKDLEYEFVQSFHRLTRKDDVSLSAEIDPKTFAVRLIGENGEEIDKNELSAGEKQIYAISILEALGKTSGRRLPIIIDTPLGRLDSKHRSKLINNYFPTASHQVIVLSTDTEVDENFYSDLSTNISHAYKLDYDSKSGSSSAQEGYFWKLNIEETA